MAVELAFTELATVTGIDLDETRTPGVVALVRMANERKSWRDYESQRQEDDAKAEADRFRTMPSHLIGYEPELVPQFRRRR